MSHRSFAPGTLSAQGSPRWFGMHPCAVGLLVIALPPALVFMYQRAPLPTLVILASAVACASAIGWFAAGARHRRKLD